MDSSNGIIETSIENKIATITFSHPASNSFPSNLLKDLTNQLQALSEDDLVSIIILLELGYAIR